MINSHNLNLVVVNLIFEFALGRVLLGLYLYDGRNLEPVWVRVFGVIGSVTAMRFQIGCAV